MRKSLAAVAAIASLATAAWAAESLREPGVVTVAGPWTEKQVRSLPAALPPVPLLQDDTANYRKPILKAAGTQRVGEGEERITIPVDGVAYEVVVTRPGLGAMIPLDH